MKLEVANFNIEILHHDPMVYVVERFLSDKECDLFKEIASNDMKRSKVSGFDKEKNRRGLLDNRRTSSHSWIQHSYDKTTTDVALRISELVQVPITHAEAYQILHYSDSQEYQAHHDTFDPSVKDYQHYLKNGGQRIITAIAYLNNVKKGGETSFPSIDRIITPQKGKIVVFQNCYKGTDKPHPDSLHGALPVIKGEKWAFNLWFRKNPRKQ